MKDTDKKIFLIVSADKGRRSLLEEVIQARVSLATVYTASDGSEALSKIVNDPPHVIVTDAQLPKVDGYGLVKNILKNRNLDATAAIFVDPPPVDAIFIDELVIGRVQFMMTEFNQGFDEAAFCKILFRAMNYVSHSHKAEYYLRFLVGGEVLLNEGEKADYVYFVKKGLLRAYHVAEAAKVILGEIGVGEFVGEMAYFNGGQRSATVQAVTDCELIEVPLGVFENILYTRPSWSKALMHTLTKRLKKANDVISSEG